MAAYPTPGASGPTSRDDRLGSNPACRPSALPTITSTKAATERRGAVESDARRPQAPEMASIVPSGLTPETTPTRAAVPTLAASTASAPTFGRGWGRSATARRTGQTDPKQSLAASDRRRNRPNLISIDGNPA